jgi:hypothetical protein
MGDEIKIRSDINTFPSVGEALDEALIRAEGHNVFIHKPDNSRPHDLNNGEACWCNPLKVEGKDFNK